MRGCELTADQIEGYLFALGGLSPVAVFDALAGLLRDDGGRAMPTAKSIRERCQRDARDRRARESAKALDSETWHTDQERAEIQAHIDNWKAQSPLFKGQADDA